MRRRWLRQAGNTCYDIVVPGDCAVQILVEQGLPAEIRPDLMENFHNLDPDHVGVYRDPGRRYTLPWRLGFTGHAVNGAARQSTADRQSLLFDPPQALSGSIAMLDDMVSVIHAAERHVGVPRCTGDRIGAAMAWTVSAVWLLARPLSP